jgi:hypothetical protein
MYLNFFKLLIYNNLNGGIFLESIVLFANKK